MKHYDNEDTFIKDISQNIDAESLKVVKSYRYMKTTNIIVLLLTIMMFLTLLYLKLSEIIINDFVLLMLYTTMCIFALIGSFVSNRIIGKQYFRYIKKNNIDIMTLL